LIFDAHMHPLANFMSQHDMGAPGFDLHTTALVQETIDAYELDGVLLLSKSGEQLVEMTEAIEGAYGLIWITFSPTYVDEVARWLEHPKIIGIKLHPLADGYDPTWPMMDPLYELAAARDAALLFHTGHEFGSLPWLIEKAARRHPRARFVMAHMGLHSMVYVDAAIEAAERTPNLYVDTAAMPFIWKVKEAVKRIGEDRVMYGSDAPFFDPRIELEKIRMAGLTERQLERVFATNALEVYFNDSNRPTLGHR
jgi:predicted TIM-barrel fold metal-dependent hydrolase